jgi:hypothetical protein
LLQDLSDLVSKYRGCATAGCAVFTYVGRDYLGTVRRREREERERERERGGGDYLGRVRRRAMREGRRGKRRKCKPFSIFLAHSLDQ